MLFKKIYNFFMRFLASIIFLFLATTNVWGLPKCKGDDYKKWTNCFAKVELPNGNYSGEWKDGLFHGKGKLQTIGLIAEGIFNNNEFIKGKKTYRDGSTYEGEFKNWMSHGKGKYIDPIRNHIFEGNWFEGELHGEGMMDLGFNKYTGTFNKGDREGFGEEITYIDTPNEGKYIGEFKYDTYHGKGKISYKDGSYQEGNFKNGFLNGKGIWSYSDGAFHKGNFIDGVINGEGEYKSSEGDIYVGNFKDGLAHGKGKQTYAEGDIYEGDFLKGELTGFGKLSYSNGDSYEGNLIRGLKSGKGTYNWKLRKEKYIGDWKEDLRDGEGTNSWPNGESYTGQFKSDLYHGKGSYIYADGASYVGNFFQGQFEGKGVITYKNGDRYEGDVQRWVENGIGTMVYGDDTEGWKKYSGEWSEGLESGKGLVEYKNGDIYEGDFKASQFDGKGTFKFKDGDKYVGEFKLSQFHGNGKYFYTHGGYYDGEWKKDEYNGFGILVSSDKSTYKGNFLNGCEHGYGEKVYKKDLKGRVAYKGNWDNCKISGKGEMKYADGSTYAGLFKDGEKLKGSTKIAQFETNEKYYALVIGNNNYQKKEKLSAAVNDAKVISNILQDKYGFEVTTLIDAKYSEVVDSLISFTKDRKPLDNLLIYYAGHGELSSDENKGYWLPVDAGEEQDSKWISNDIVRNRIKATKAKHVLLVVDSCFAGSISRGGAGVSKSIEKLNNINVINRFKMRKTRLVITSGGNEPVSDSDGGKHSVFANKFIDVLKNNNNVIQSMYLFQNVSDYVINNAQQTPNRTIIHGTGDDGGDFLFFPTG